MAPAINADQLIKPVDWKWNVFVHGLACPGVVSAASGVTANANVPLEYPAEPFFQV